MNYNLLVGVRLIMKKPLSILLCLLYYALSYAQEQEPMVQFTGRIFNEYLQPMPYTSVYVKNRGKGAITDREGKFSFVVLEKDTVVFSSVGYKSGRVIIPGGFDEPFFTRDVLLESDTIMIEAIEVYPWSDYEEFTEAFLNLELPESDLDRARRNIAIIKAQMIVDNNPSVRGNFDQIIQEQFNDMSVRGTNPTYQIFNVFAWSKFLKALKNGDFKQNK